MAVTAMIASIPMSAASTVVQCTAKIVMEDHFPGDVGTVIDHGDPDGGRGGTHFGYVLCVESSRRREDEHPNVYLLKDQSPDTTSFSHDQVLELELMSAPLSDAELEECLSPSCRIQSFEVVSVIDSHSAPPVAPPTQEAVAASGAVDTAANGARTILFMRVEYQDDSVSYCDEACVRDRAYAGTRNMDEMYRESSYNTISFPSSSVRVVTVRLAKRAVDQANCPYWNIGLDADAAVRSQLGFEPNDYTHRAYYIPTTIPGCSFGGLAYVGCSSTYCKSWMRTSSGTTLAHEIGHNLGWRHAGLDTEDDGQQNSEYGDVSGIMGSAWQWRGVNAPHRIQSGWIPSTAVRSITPSCSASQQFRLGGLAYTPGSKASTSVVTLARTGAGGGTYYISYRAASGYDATMSSLYKSKVLINYKIGNSNSQLVKALETGDTYSLKAGSQAQLRVLQIDNDAATVQLTFCGATVSSTQSTAATTVGTASTTASTAATTKTTTRGCDYAPDLQSSVNCNYWADKGYCAITSIYYGYMASQCATTCKIGDDDCSSTVSTAPPITTTKTTTLSTTTKATTVATTTKTTTVPTTTTATTVVTTTDAPKTTTSSTAQCTATGALCSKSTTCCDGLRCSAPWVLGNPRCLVNDPTPGTCFESRHICTSHDQCCSKLCSDDLVCVADATTSISTTHRPVDCVGEWTLVSSECDASNHCGTGTSVLRFTIVTSAQGDGADCDHSHGDVKTITCSSTPCTTTTLSTSSSTQGCVTWSTKRKEPGEKCKKAKECCSGNCNRKRCVAVLGDLPLFDPDVNTDEVDSNSSDDTAKVTAGVLSFVGIIVILAGIAVRRKRQIKPDLPVTSDEGEDGNRPISALASVRRTNPLYGNRPVSIQLDDTTTESTGL